VANAALTPFSVVSGGADGYILSQSGLLEKIGPTAARFPPKMLLLMDQWVDFSSGRAIPPTWQQFPTQNVNPGNFGENQTAVCLIFSKNPPQVPGKERR
jgi:hypothetical protein